MKPGRENHVIALYKHNNWPFDEKEVFSHEWEAIQKTYLNSTPLLRLVCPLLIIIQRYSHSLHNPGCSHNIQLEEGITNGTISLSSEFLEPGSYLITWEDTERHGWSKFLSTVFLQILHPTKGAVNRLLSLLPNIKLKYATIDMTRLCEARTGPLESGEHSRVRSLLCIDTVGDTI